MIEIIPAIDIIDGKCVRLSQGDFSKKTIYREDPLEVAKEFEKAGIKRLHLVDLDGARHGKLKNLKVLKTLAENTKLKIDFGGGIKTDDDIESVFDAGAAMATIGSIAVKHPEILVGWLKRFGSKKILLGADVKNERLVINGWLKQTNIGMYEFIDRNMKRGVDTLFCTDVAKDGMLKGSSVHLYSRIIQKFPGLNLIASGGVSSIDDIAVLQRMGCKGVIIGKALYEGNITLEGFENLFKIMALAKRIIPCLDVQDGRTVKGINFVNIRDAGDAVELGELYAKEGADELVFLDITATIEERKTFAELVTRIARHVNIPFTVGGGISSVNDVSVLLNAGADKISVNTAAVKNPQLLNDQAKQFGSQCVVLAIDTKNENGDWFVYLNGGRTPTTIKTLDWAKEAAERGAGEILLTSMNNDGTKNGFALDITRRISEAVNIPVIASGGAGTMQHFCDVFNEGKADAALAASIFHYKEIGIPELKKYLKRNNIEVRI